MKRILEPDSHASVVDATIHQVLQAEMEPMDRVRRIAALLPHIEPPAHDRLVDVAFQLPGPPIDDDETLCAEIVDMVLRDFGKPLREDRRFGEYRHNLAARIVELSLSDRERETIRRRRGPRVQLLEQIMPSLSEAGLHRAVDLILELPAIERADGIAALIKVTRGNLRRRLLRALFELESPFGRLWALFNSQDALRTDDDPELAQIAQATAESFTRPKNIAGCLLMLIGYAKDEQESWIRRAAALSETLPTDDRLQVLTVVTRMARNDPNLTRAAIDNICALPTPDLVHTGAVMATRLDLDMSASTAAEFDQLRVAMSSRLRFAAQRGRSELLRTLADEATAFTALSTADGIYEMARAVRDVCVEWRWPSSA